MDKETREHMRENVKSILCEMIEKSEQIPTELQEVRRNSRGQAHISLDPRKGTYIVQTENSFVAGVLYKDQKYEVSVMKLD